MKKKLKLNFSSDRKIKMKKTKAFIISFAAFILVLGSISILIFMKSVNFDLKNLKPESSENTTTAEKVTGNESVTLEGSANIILICTDNQNSLISLSLLNCDMNRQCIVLVQIPISDSVSVNGVNQTFNDILSKSGSDVLKTAVSDYCSLTVDRYIRVNNSELKKIVAKTGDVTLNIPEAVNYKNEDYNLLLDAGRQSLTSDMFCKYLQYCTTEQKGEAMTSYLNTLLAVKNIPSEDSLFNFIVNNSKSDITIVDYTNTSKIISTYIQNKVDQSVSIVKDKAELGRISDEK